MDPTASEMNWARRMALRACKRMSVRCDEDFYQAAVVALWRVKEQTRLAGKELRTRAYKRVAGSVVDEIRSRLGRRLRGNPYPHCVSFVPRSRAVVGGEPLDELICQEEAARAVAPAPPRVKLAVMALLQGCSIREAAESVARSEAWLRVELKKLRVQAGREANEVGGRADHPHSANSGAAPDLSMSSSEQVRKEPAHEQQGIQCSPEGVLG